MPEHFVDACGLAPPEPLLRLFAALDASAPGDRVWLLIDREPTLLFQILRLNGLQFSYTRNSDTVHLITVWRGEGHS
jgi:TusA-related sulfurtransferase